MGAHLTPPPGLEGIDLSDTLTKTCEEYFWNAGYAARMKHDGEQHTPAWSPDDAFCVDGAVPRSFTEDNPAFWPMFTEYAKGWREAAGPVDESEDTGADSSTPRWVDANGVPTVAGAEAMFAAVDEARGKAARVSAELDAREDRPPAEAPNGCRPVSARADGRICQCGAGVAGDERADKPICDDGLCWTREPAPTESPATDTWAGCTTERPCRACATDGAIKDTVKDTGAGALVERWAIACSGQVRLTFRAQRAFWPRAMSFAGSDHTTRITGIRVRDRIAFSAPGGVSIGDAAGMAVLLGLLRELSRLDVGDDLTIETTVARAAEVVCTLTVAYGPRPVVGRLVTQERLMELADKALAAEGDDDLVAIPAAEFRRLLEHIDILGTALDIEAGDYCRACGCTEHTPCDPPCSWVGEGLCSACAEREVRAGLLEAAAVLDPAEMALVTHIAGCAVCTRCAQHGQPPLGFCAVGAELAAAVTADLPAAAVLPDFDPADCDRAARTCGNCGRGFAHDDACPPLPTADAADESPVGLSVGSVQRLAAREAREAERASRIGDWMADNNKGGE